MDRGALGRFADLLNGLFEVTEEIDFARTLAKLAHDATATPYVQQRMQMIVDKAREFTRASSASFSLFEPTRHDFTDWAFSPKNIQLRDPAATGHTFAVRSFRDLVLIPDTKNDPRIPKEIREAIRSLVSIPVAVHETPIGILVVNSDKPRHFTNDHVNHLKLLADLAGDALGHWRPFVQTAEDVTQSTSGLIESERVARDICNQMIRDFDFDFVALQIVRERERTLETVEMIVRPGVNIKKSWAGRSTHSLDDIRRIRDIQADIYHSRNAEVIHGKDPRFDPWIFSKYGHSTFSRAWIPIILVKKPDGEWGPWVGRIGHPRHFAGTNYRVAMTTPRTRQSRVIGTLEVGYTAHKDIPVLTLKKAITAISDRATRISDAQLPRILDRILDRATELIRADSATLHFLKGDNGQYIFESASRGDLSRRLLKCKPRKGIKGLGFRAIRDGQPKFISDPKKLLKKNRDVYRMGVRSMGAFPITVGDHAGVLYTHFKGDHFFAEEETAWVKLLSRAAEGALRHATAYADLHDQAAKFGSLPEIITALADEKTLPKALGRLVWDTKYLLASDVVTLYEYHDKRKRFATPPYLAGRLIVASRMTTPIQEGNAPVLLVTRGTNVYAPDVNVPPPREYDVLRGISLRRRPSFVERERVRASAGVILRTRGEIVGVMFVNFRRPHLFPIWERRLLEGLAAAAAVVIRNRRLSQETKEIAELGALRGDAFHDIRNGLSDACSRFGRLKSTLSVATTEIKNLLGSVDKSRDLATNVLRLKPEKSEKLLLREIIAKAKRDFVRSRGCKININVPRDIPSVRFGRKQLERIFGQLFQNAKRAIDNRGTIDVSAKRSDSLLIVEVSDSGPGIPEDRRDQVFALGYSTKGGTGYGLWWIRSVLRLEGGDITIESTGTKGSKFVLHLPRD